MGFYARRDISGVSVSVAHGGCGNTHSRPVDNGIPAEVWNLEPDCMTCRNALAGDPHWASSISEIPETPDETRAREDRERRGSADLERATGTALEELAKMPGAFEKLAQILATQQRPSVTCPDGHQNAPGVKFCAECGKSLTPAVSEPQGDAEPPAGDEPDRSSVPLKDRRLDELKAMCAERGLDDQGKRADLLDRLRNAADGT